MHLTGKPLPLCTGSITPPQPAPALPQAGPGTRAGAGLSAFAACALWLQRLRDSLPALWCLAGSRILARDTKRLQQLTQLVWDNAETPVRLGC